MRDKEIDCRSLAEQMLGLQNSGCHNINFVSPSHFVPQMVRAVLEAVPLGLKLPLVYNTGGYDSVETLKVLDGIIDIYLPDFSRGSERPGCPRLAGRLEPSFECWASVHLLPA